MAENAAHPLAAALTACTAPRAPTTARLLATLGKGDIPPALLNSALDRAVLHPQPKLSAFLVALCVAHPSAAATALPHLLSRLPVVSKTTRAAAAGLLSTLLCSLSPACPALPPHWDALVGALSARADDVCPKVRAAAVPGLARLATGEAGDSPTTALLTLLECDASSDVRAAVAGALTLIRTTLPALLARARDVSSGVRTASLSALCDLVDPALLTGEDVSLVLAPGLTDSDPACVALATRFAARLLAGMDWSLDSLVGMIMACPGTAGEAPPGAPLAAATLSALFAMGEAPTPGAREGGGGMTSLTCRGRRLTCALPRWQKGWAPRSAISAPPCGGTPPPTTCSSWVRTRRGWRRGAGPPPPPTPARNCWTSSRSPPARGAGCCRAARGSLGWM